jgi:hypothetical protein
MEEKYLSIITNFGCHYSCPYCIVKNNNIDIPVTTLDGLTYLPYAFKDFNCNLISISGGGDPLFEYEKHIEWYRRLMNIALTSFKEPIPIEMHTSYMTTESTFPFHDCYRVVYHANNFEQLKQIHRIGNELTRVVFVVDERLNIEDIMKIAAFVHDSKEIDELSFRQMVGAEYQTFDYLEDYLKLGHKKLWWYIEQRDYNLYFSENKVYDGFRYVGKEYLEIKRYY